MSKLYHTFNPITKTIELKPLSSASEILWS